jgi:hypothetical protein
MGIVSEVVAEGAAQGRALEVAEGIAAAPRFAVRETKRRILLDRERYEPLFAEEARVFREALLGSEPDDAA